MGNGLNAIPGQYDVFCDRTGFRVKAFEALKEWNGLFVRRESFEERQPLDFLRGVRDDQSVPISRPEGADRFLTKGEVTPDSLP